MRDSKGPGTTPSESQMGQSESVWCSCILARAELGKNLANERKRRKGMSLKAIPS